VVLSLLYEMHIVFNLPSPTAYALPLRCTDRWRSKWGRGDPCAASTSRAGCTAPGHAPEQIRGSAPARREGEVGERTHRRRGRGKMDKVEGGREEVE